mmetsp:Transcript_30394/g.46383  ORF Transcript_30394/g.46383 Transcript_30394/m.46383 type:complete len:415 (+) Transcript_30394:264-1508(+)|eukprot:CAMPEP_0194203216 /NCGR_PEP_ID=MMETSP0156-20130528/3061_1 /TAXON_ID=33649 /ORGANISM="Thalassionema nitzschioides, Strain L26-B" /LENGTH=414 /DNA_ID=CAMNT_0038928921 /DNA_START=180 /DNA_END=1424 /DNA_ORIENTATION=-
MSDDHDFANEAGNNSNATNKWSKNGFGEPCLRSGGKFSRDETETVRRAVEEYCATKNISTSRLCSECDHKAELKGAWMEIAKRLPHRTVQSVYRHGLRQLHPFRRGPWTEQECQMLCDLVTRMGKKWSAIQAKLNRSADSCRDKFREMSSDYVKGRWKEGETEILKRLIREHLQADPNADIKELGKKAEQEGIIIPWSTISKRMGKRSRLSCFKKWQKMTGLYSPSDQPMTGVAATTTTVTIASKPMINSSIADSSLVENLAPVNLPESARNAPTAGAAAAAAANARLGQNNEDDHIDLFLLTSLASSSITHGTEIDWNSIQGINDPSNRWVKLVQEWEESLVGKKTYDFSKISISDLAQLILDRKQEQQQQATKLDPRSSIMEEEDDGTGDLAKMAAETVEAVDLPTLNTREV